MKSEPSVSKKQLVEVMRLWGRGHNAERLADILPLLSTYKLYTIDELVALCPGNYAQLSSWEDYNPHVRDMILAFNIAVDISVELPADATIEEKEKINYLYYTPIRVEKREKPSDSFWKHDERGRILYVRMPKHLPGDTAEPGSAPKARKWCPFLRYKDMCHWGVCVDADGICQCYYPLCRFDEGLFWDDLLGCLWDYGGDWNKRNTDRKDPSQSI